VLSEVSKKHLLKARITTGILIIAASVVRCGPGSQQYFNTVPEGKEARNADSANGFMMPVAILHTGRAAHTATLLNDGRVLVTGGFAGNSLSSAEVYDPVKKSFTNAGNMAVPRSGHSATLLPNGKVLIAGGYNGDYLSGSEFFDPGTETFSPGPVMTTARSGHTATVLKNGKVLFAGGVGRGWSFLQSAELYEPTTNSFISTGMMSTARESHTASLLKNGKVLITGGHKGRRQNISIYSSAELYDPASGKFERAGDMHIIRHKHDAVQLADGKVLINGGSDQRDTRGAYSSSEIFDPESSSFKTAGNMHLERYKHNGTSILLPGGKVLIAGGAKGSEIYEPSSGSFRMVPGDYQTVLLFSCATLLQNGQVLVTGGYNEKQEISAKCWLYTYPGY